MARILSLLGALLIAMSSMGGAAAAGDLENTLYMETEHGRVVIELRTDVAPLHAERIKELTRQGFYDGIVFHRVIAHFMAQTGDPTGTGTGGSGKNLRAEFSDASFERGTVGMARSQNPDSADSQFFICFEPTPHLNGQYTVVGKVTDGMDAIDKLAVGEPPRHPDKIVSMTVAADN
jgi:cyclophilin family peptidyl-prolyl cis-trans isomerase